MCRKMHEMMQNFSWEATTLHAKRMEYIKMSRGCETNITFLESCPTFGFYYQNVSMLQAGRSRVLFPMT
jgi:hypothetical protein